MKKLWIAFAGMTLLLLGSVAYALPGDLQVDGGSAFSTFAQTGLESPPPQVAEPGMLILLGSGILGLCLIYR